MWLFALFVAVPLIEIALFIQVGGLIGLWPTLGIVVVTAILGTWLVKQQGRLALGQLRGSLRDLRDPSEPLAHGAMILVSGAMLLTPGFFTDAVGFLLLVPQVRSVVFRELRQRIKVQRFEMGRPPSGPPPRHDFDLEGEVVQDETDQPPPPRATPGSSGWTRH